MKSDLLCWCGNSIGNFMILTLAVGMVVLALLVLIYNKLIASKNQIENAFASIDVMLKKRVDLIPNLVSITQQYMKHETQTLTEITELRTKAMSESMSAEQKIEVQKQISHSLHAIKVAVEGYPELKADLSFQNLMRSLNEVEEQISAARRSFNAAVTHYNNAIEMFPSNIMAKFMGYSRRHVFEIQNEERENVNVKSLFND